MGTHPIFESDFDCLTDRKNGPKQITFTRAAPVPITLAKEIVKIVIIVFTSRERRKQWLT